MTSVPPVDGTTMRAQVVDAAVELFSRKGYHGTSMRQIASVIGVQISSLYHYYPSKQDLLFDIMQSTMNRLLDKVERATSAAFPDARREMAAMIRAHVIFHGTYQREALISDSELSALEGAYRDAIMDLRDNYDARFRDILVRGQKQQLFLGRQVNSTAFAITSMCNGVARWYRPGGPSTLAEIADEYVALVESGVLDRTSAVRKRAGRPARSPSAPV